MGWSYPTCILLAGETCPLFKQQKYGRPILLDFVESKFENFKLFKLKDNFSDVKTVV